MATKKNNKPPKVIRIRDVEYVGMGVLSNMAEKNQMSLRRLMKEGKLPESNWRMPPLSNGVLGKRLYTLKLAEKIAPILRDEVRQGVPITTETVVKLAILFKQEKEGTL